MKPLLKEVNITESASHNYHWSQGHPTHWTPWVGSGPPMLATLMLQLQQLRHWGWAVAAFIPWSIKWKQWKMLSSCNQSHKWLKFIQLLLSWLLFRKTPSLLLSTVSTNSEFCYIIQHLSQVSFQVGFKTTSVFTPVSCPSTLSRIVSWRCVFCCQ